MGSLSRKAELTTSCTLVQRPRSCSASHCGRACPLQDAISFALSPCAAKPGRPVTVLRDVAQICRPWLRFASTLTCVPCLYCFAFDTFRNGFCPLPLLYRRFGKADRSGSALCAFHRQPWPRNLKSDVLSRSASFEPIPWRSNKLRDTLVLSVTNLAARLLTNQGKPIGLLRFPRYPPV